MTALIEGDATATMQRFALQEVSLKDQIALLGDPTLGRQEAELEKFPVFLQKSLLFPYEAGLTFVCSLLHDGGWTAVDAAYKAPPVSTAQILFPERYRAKERPIDARDVPTPAGWTRTRTTAAGAADLMMLFQTVPALAGTAKARAAAWAGGEVTQFAKGKTSGLGLALVQRKGSTGLCQSVSRWYKGALGASQPVATQPGETFALDGARQDAVLRCAGAEVRLGIGPDIATARTLAG
jgi:hypothetical protein